LLKGGRVAELIEEGVELGGKRFEQRCSQSPRKKKEGKDLLFEGRNG